MPDEPAQEPRAPKGEPPGSDWAAYYRSTIGREPRPLFAKGMTAVDAAGVIPGQAIEIGFGDGRETLVGGGRRRGAGATIQNLAGM